MVPGWQVGGGRRQSKGKARASSRSPWTAANRFGCSTRYSFNPAWSPDGRFILYSEQQSAGQFEVKAITPDQAPVSIVEVQIFGFSRATRYRFLPDGKSLVVLEGTLGGSQNFVRVDLADGKRRQLTAFKAGSVIQDFDVSPDGTHIVFDRLRDNSDIVLMNLAR